MIKRNKEYFMNSLKENTDLSEEQILKVDEVLDEHFIIGRNNKDKMVADFVEKLEISEEEADKLYNTCMETIVKGIFR